MEKGVSKYLGEWCGRHSSKTGTKKACEPFVPRSHCYPWFQCENAGKRWEICEENKLVSKTMETLAEHGQVWRTMMSYGGHSVKIHGKYYGKEAFQWIRARPRAHLSARWKLQHIEELMSSGTARNPRPAAAFFWEGNQGLGVPGSPTLGNTK